MLKYLRNKKAQVTLEYVLVLIIVLLAIFASLFYIKRGIQGRAKDSTDQVGDQFSPGNQNYISVTTTSSNVRDKFLAGFGNRYLLEDEVTTTNSNSEIINTEFEFMGN